MLKNPTPKNIVPYLVKTYGHCSHDGEKFHHALKEFKLYLRDKYFEKKMHSKVTLGSVFAYIIGETNEVAGLRLRYGLSGCGETSRAEQNLVETFRLLYNGSTYEKLLEDELYYDDYDDGDDDYDE